MDAQIFYNRWKHDLPIEYVVNICLLLSKRRNVIQLDVDKHLSILSLSAVLTELSENVIRHYDSYGNIILYLVSNKTWIEKKLVEIGNGEISKAFRTGRFADLLDRDFYHCRAPFPAILGRSATKVMIHVIQSETRSGSILTQMTVRRPRQLWKLYKRFLEITSYIESIDPALQTSLTFYTKPGTWCKGPEYNIGTYRTLPKVMRC